MSSRFRSRSSLILALCLMFSFSLASASSAYAKDDPKAQREQVRKQKAAIAAQIDVLKASDQQIQAALSALTDNVKSSEALLADSQRAATDAATQAAAAKVAADQKAAELATRRAELKEIAVQSYISPTETDPIMDISIDDASELVRQQELLAIWSKRADDIADSVEVAAADLSTAQLLAETASAAAVARQDEVQGKVDELRTAKAQQKKLQGQVESKLEAALAESAALSTLDKTLSDQIARESAKYNTGGGSSGRLATGSVSLRTVGGITVAASIADNVASLLSAADADGIHFGGGGYRDSSAQVSLRRQNCGSSDYAIYSAPASSCHPPTARPGASMHERGLAIDFTYNGSVIGTHSSPGYQWLSKNASKYGLYNLPSEPWHWSVNGN